MTRTLPAPEKHRTPRMPSPPTATAGKPAPVVSARDSRAPVQILRSTKEWLDQIIDEQTLRSYDEAIMFLIAERQRHLSSDFGVFSDLEPYVCNGED
jgi:hypothetical protein